MRKLIVSIAVVAVMAAACGSDGDDTLESVDGAATDASDAQDDSTTDDQGDAGGDDPATGDANSAWCVEARAAAEADESPLDLNLLAAGPEELEARLTQNLAVFEEWEDRAPPEIEDQVGTLAESFRSLVALAEEADWDLVTLGTDPDALAAFDTADLETAANDIDRYTSDVCGVDLDAAVNAGSADSSPVPGTGDGDLATEFLAKFGLPADFLTEDQLACVTAELERAYPDGIPGQLIIDEETGELFNSAAAACGLGVP